MVKFRIASFSIVCIGLFASAIALAGCHGGSPYPWPNPYSYVPPTYFEAPVTVDAPEGAQPSDYQIQVIAMGGYVDENGIVMPAYSGQYSRTTVRTINVTSFSDTTVEYADFAGDVKEYLALVEKVSGVQVDLAELNDDNAVALAARERKYASSLPVTITDPDGNPVPGGYVFISSRQNDSYTDWLKERNLDANGRWVIQALDPYSQFSNPGAPYQGGPYLWRKTNVGGDGTALIEGLLPLETMLMPVVEGYRITPQELNLKGDPSGGSKADPDTGLYPAVQFTAKKLGLCDVAFYIMDENGDPMPTATGRAVGDKLNTVLSIQLYPTDVPNPKQPYTGYANPQSIGSADVIAFPDRRYDYVAGDASSDQYGDSAYSLSSFSPGIIWAAEKSGGAARGVERPTRLFGLNSWSMNFSSTFDQQDALDGNGKLSSEFTLPEGEYRAAAGWSESYPQDDGSTVIDNYSFYGTVVIAAGSADIKLKLPFHDRIEQPPPPPPSQYEPLPPGYVWGD